MDYLVLICYILKFSSFFLRCYGRNWRRIYVRLQTVCPERVKMTEGTSVTAYCGSLTQVNWSFSTIDIYRGETETSPLDLSPISERHVKGYYNLTLVNLSEADTGYFYCHGSYRDIPFVRPIHVEVMKLPKIGKILPSWIETTAGSSVTLFCGSIKPTLWFSSYLHSQNKTVKHNSLTIHNIGKEHSGPYVCRGVDWRKNIFHAHTRVIVDGYTETVPNEWSTELFHFLLNPYLVF